MIESIPTKPSARDQLMSDLKTVIHDAESWLRSGSQMTGDELAAARAKFERTLSNAKADLIHLEETVVQRAKLAARSTDDFVTENPWKAVGVGAAAGILIGMLLARR